MTDYSTPYQISARHAQTGQIQHTLFDPFWTITEFRKRFRTAFGTRPKEIYDWVGLKQGDRVIARVTRLEDGTWELEIVDKEVKNGETA